MSHPNIAAIYGLEVAEDKRFLVMEYVEGETLAQRLAKGPLPLEEALEVCRQIADGVEAAHEKGIIHRDLKPANVKITPDGTVKVLDFGLAKALSGETSPADGSPSPATPGARTHPGMILGTAAYMSPEQAKGRRLDRRADIWAFGCILYECLTGKGFPGRDGHGDAGRHPQRGTRLDGAAEDARARVQAVLQRCLQKDLKLRYHDIADAWLALEGNLRGSLRTQSPLPGDSHRVAGCRRCCHACRRHHRRPGADKVFSAPFPLLGRHVDHQGRAGPLARRHAQGHGRRRPSRTAMAISERRQVRRLQRDRGESRPSSEASVVSAENGSSGSQAYHRDGRWHQPLPVTRRPLGGILGRRQAEEGPCRRWRADSRCATLPDLRSKLGS